jgi:hypothetical protein
MAETLNKVFIDVEVEDSIRNDAALAAKLEEVCPVDIYKDAGGTIEIVDENCDECVRQEALRRHRALLVPASSPESRRPAEAGLFRAGELPPNRLTNVRRE